MYTLNSGHLLDLPGFDMILIKIHFHAKLEHDIFIIHCALCGAHLTGMLSRQ